MKKRHPAVAGQFYPADKGDLGRMLEECFLGRMGPGKSPRSGVEGPEPVGIISPHAGYAYSGGVAAHGYHRISGIEGIRLFIILGPNHWGVGSGLAISESSVWETPLGELEVDMESRERIIKRSGLIDIDDVAHAQEHSIEVQMPFLQYTFPEPFKILPISLALQDRQSSREVGEAVAELIAGLNYRSMMVASSDLTHYEDHAVASRKDAELISRVLELDVDGFYRVLERSRVSACGFGAIAAAMTAARKLGAKEGTLLKYATSGDATGDYSSVVGYPSVALT